MRNHYINTYSVIHQFLGIMSVVVFGIMSVVVFGKIQFQHLSLNLMIQVNSNQYLVRKVITAINGGNLHSSKQMVQCLMLLLVNNWSHIQFSWKVWNKRKSYFVIILLSFKKVCSIRIFFSVCYPSVMSLKPLCTDLICRSWIALLKLSCKFTTVCLKRLDQN